MIHLKIKNHEHALLALAKPPLFANDMDTSTEAGAVRLNRLLYTAYDGDALDVVASCPCTNIHGGTSIGRICEECLMPCTNATTRPLESMLWLRVPRGIDAFINPVCWVILAKAMRFDSTPILEWLCDPTFKLTKKPSSKIRLLQAEGIERGLNYFIANFDRIVKILFINPRVKSPKREVLDTLEWIRINRDAIFTRYLPMPSTLSLVVERNADNIGQTDDRKMTAAIEALRTVTSIDTSMVALPKRYKEARVTKAIMTLAGFYRNYVSAVLSQKPGIIRHHICGGRLHWSARAVIASISGPHQYNELHAPWSLGIQLYKVHLQSKLRKRGFTAKAMHHLLSTYTNKYHPLIDELLNELISESPHMGLPVIFQRNPTLGRASAQLLYITKFHTNPLIYTIGLSVLVLVGFGADYDGDEMNMFPLLDYRMFAMFSRLEPHLASFNMSVPYAISGNLKMPTPVVSTFANWLAEEDDLPMVA